MTHLTVKIHEEIPKDEVCIRQSWADIVRVTSNKCKCHVVLWRQRGHWFDIYSTLNEMTKRYGVI